jgi:hypothetical protein
MTDKPKKLSDTARALLTAAAMRDDHLMRPPKLPITAARQVVRSLLNAGLAEVAPASIGAPDFVWRTGDDGKELVLRVTALGLGRIGEAESTTPATVMAGTLADTVTRAAEAQKPPQAARPQ